MSSYNSYGVQRNVRAAGEQGVNRYDATKHGLWPLEFVIYLKTMSPGTHASRRVRLTQSQPASQTALVPWAATLGADDKKEATRGRARRSEEDMVDGGQKGGRAA